MNLKYLNFAQGVCEDLGESNLAGNQPSSTFLVDLEQFLQNLEDRVIIFPKTIEKLRFGDPNFRRWHEYLLSKIPNLLSTISPSIDTATKEEFTIYLQDSFGSVARLDYGTGHELNFVAFLCCLEHLQIVDKCHRRKVATGVFKRYVQLTRTLQMYFQLEPAGSLGVWGLDDFCFIPFLWGSAQLQKSTTKPSDLKADPFFAEDGNLFFDSCRHVKSTKSGPLEIVSPTLASLCTVPTWSRVSRGLFKMYCGECIDKFQIMQHFYFGKLLPLEKI
jgi:serine/threonine-protein phosphatase 2A activator